LQNKTYCYKINTYNTNEAVQKTDEATVKEIAQLGWAEAYANYGADAVKLEEGVKSALTKNNLKPEDYGMVVTTNGVTIKKGWLKDGFTVVKGEKVLEIGDVVEYKAGVGTYNGTWKVLGADDKGNLLVMSDSNVNSSFLLGDSTDLKKSQDSWQFSVSLLNKECEPYGNGEGAIGARSITIEDVDSITGYDKTTYKKGELEQYGNEVTYSYNGTNTPTYTVGELTDTVTTAHENNEFSFFNGEEVETKSDLITGANGTSFATIITDYYAYTASDVLTENEKAYSMLFGNNDTKYWLAYPYTSVSAKYIAYGVSNVENGKVRYCGMWASNGSKNQYSNGVRAVVMLSPNLDLNWNETTLTWEY